jgi:AraC family transcriptional regulator
MNVVLPKGAYYGRSVSSKEVAGLLLTEKVHADATPRHEHSSPYLCLVMSGNWIEGYDGGTRQCATNTVIYHPAGEVHWDHFTGNGGRVFAIELGDRWLDRLETRNRTFQEPHVFSNGIVPWAALRICDESRRLDSASPLVIEGLMLEVLGSVERAGQGVAPHPAPRWLALVEQVLRDEYRAPPLVTHLARMVGVHPIHLARAFRTRHGCSAAEYVTRIRVEHACHLMVRSHRGLAEIAAEVGFSDQSHLTKAFHRVMGTTPAKYRAALRLNAR